MLPLFRAVVKFCSTNRLFKYFLQRYSKKQIGDQNDMIKLRGKIRTAKFSMLFYRLCLAKRVAPKFISALISRFCARRSPSIERALSMMKFLRLITQIRYNKRSYKCQWAKILKVLSFFGLFRFCRFLSKTDQRTEILTKEMHDRNIQLLRKKRFVGM